ncbi:hypothetical protein [Mucilaginibacter defluvii]|uniref:Lipoprotein n=1 Tax=Mucilaginibacter defluvii TaxID=1196019 RepID=A0ABP9FYF1_9SPHI
MKPLSHSVFITIAALLMSCSSANREDKNDVQPIVSDDYESGLISKREYHSPIDNIFKDVIKKDSVLNNLSNEINDFNQAKIDSLRNYLLFNEESANYYTAGAEATKNIKDSLLKKRILQLLTLSEQRYQKRTKALNESVLNIKNNDTTMQDYYTALKIAATLPVLERYQRKNLSKFQNVTHLDSAASALKNKTKAITEDQIKKLNKN